MSTMSSTVRRIAEAESAQEPLEIPALASELAKTLKAPMDETFVDLPPIGSSVQFTLRGREYRGGRNKFAALITNIHPDTGFVDLVVVLDADDMMGQKDIPRLTAETGWGWEPIMAGAEAVAALEERLESFMVEMAAVLFGKHPKTEESVYDVLIDHEDRVQLLEPKAKAPKAKAKRRG